MTCMQPVFNELHIYFIQLFIWHMFKSCPHFNITFWENGSAKLSNYIKHFLIIFICYILTTRLGLHITRTSWTRHPPYTTHSLVLRLMYKQLLLLSWCKYIVVLWEDRGGVFNLCGNMKTRSLIRKLHSHGIMFCFRNGQFVPIAATN